MKIKYVSYHNQHPVYQQCGKQLARSLNNCGISDYHIEIVDAPGWDFSAACAYKPIFIGQCLREFADYDRIVYLDSDSVVMSYPSLFNDIPDSFDLAVHYKDGKELLGSVIWLNNRGNVIDFIDLWAKRCQNELKIWDQKHLQELLDETPEMMVYNLPPTYCQIFDSMAGHGGLPVILQMQASRFSRGIDINHNPIREVA